MKTKNVMFGVFAVILAVGSAFGSMLMPNQTAYVKSDTAPECRNANVQCSNNPSEAPCLVRVFDAQLNTDVDVQAYDETCDVELRNEVGTAIPSQIIIND